MENSTFKEFNTLRDMLEFLTQSIDKESVNKAADIITKSEETPKEEHNTTKSWEDVELTDDIYMFNEDYFSLTKKVGDINLEESDDLIFAHFTEDGLYHPGITEEQLINILAFRNKNNPKRYNLLRQLLD